jgi:2-polyprenyl-3-methyl-5-hydroxy-6-metoxy-1,4-benzoquinol methylase
MDFRQAQDVAALHAPHDYYQREYRAMERMYLPALFDDLKRVAAGRVLEIGPGWGTTAAWLSAGGHEVTVMDLMPVGTFMTQDLIDEYRITYVHNDIEDQPSPDGRDLGSFDLVIMTQVIPHLAWRPDRSLRHLAALMGPHALFVTSVLDRKDYPDLDCAFGDDWRQVPEWGTTAKCDDVVKCMYTRESFEDLLGSTFTDVSIWKPRKSTVLFARASK